MSLPVSERALAILLMASLHGFAAQDSPKKDLRAFYALNCSVCHGSDGSGRGADGSRLKGQDFTDSKEMKDFTDVELANTIRKGKKFGRMPSSRAWVISWQTTSWDRAVKTIPPGWFSPRAAFEARKYPK